MSLTIHCKIIINKWYDVQSIWMLCILSLLWSFGRVVFPKLPAHISYQITWKILKYPPPPPPTPPPIQTRPSKLDERSKSKREPYCIDSKLQSPPQKKLLEMRAHFNKVQNNIVPNLENSTSSRTRCTWGWSWMEGWQKCCSMEKLLNLLNTQSAKSQQNRPTE